MQHQLQLHSFDGHGRPLCIYGDPAYPVTLHVQGPFKGAHLNNAQKDFNASMSRVRVAVEWPFVGITEYFAFFDFKKNMKLYFVSTILYNARVCLYAPQQASFLMLNRPY